MNALKINEHLIHLQVFTIKLCESQYACEWQKKQ